MVLQLYVVLHLHLVCELHIPKNKDCFFKIFFKIFAHTVHKNRRKIKAPQYNQALSIRTRVHFRNSFWQMPDNFIQQNGHICSVIWCTWFSTSKQWQTLSARVSSFTTSSCWHVGNVLLFYENVREKQHVIELTASLNV